MDGIDLMVECGKCGEKVKATDELVKFTMCKCENRVRICLQNKSQMAHLIGAEHETNAFVHILRDGKAVLPRIPLQRWNQLQSKFKTKGHLSERQQ